MTRLFLFDFDGVIVDSIAVYEKTVTLCLEKIGQPIVKNRADFLDLFDDNFYEAIVQKGVNLEAFMKASVDVLAQANYDGIMPYLSLLPVLKKLCGDNILLIISSNGSQTIFNILQHYSIKGCFREILGADVMLSKTAKIGHAMKKYEIAADRTFYIGDTSGDILEGKRAGVKTVAVTWGWHSRDKLAAARPDYLIDHPEGLLEI